MYEYNCTITTHIDGDSVEVAIDLGFGVWLLEQSIRVHGLDTPESRTSDAEEKVFGLIAKDKAKVLLPIGSSQTLVSKAFKKGKFGRILGDFKFTETTYAEFMIENHYGVAYFGQSKDDVATEHLKNRVTLLSKPKDDDGEI